MSVSSWQDVLLMWLFVLPHSGPGIFSGQMLSPWNNVTLSRAPLMSTCDRPAWL